MSGSVGDYSTIPVRQFFITMPVLGLRHCGPPTRLDIQPGSKRRLVAHARRTPQATTVTGVDRHDIHSALLSLAVAIICSRLVDDLR
ncbi:hypothetical protein [Burkholderia ubonensis]|uniref:hypothetical protein n=1 Tax=Burkholderia ubonensis TaxID=101571 RepID=UPI000F5630BB|nr:hypothetical protein [Burkholderia ubonensis]